MSGQTQVPLSECKFTFARSSGAGGQNVNKVSSKAILHWQVTSNSSLPKDVRARFLIKYASRITSDGYVNITSQKHRDQRRNVQECVEKLEAMISTVVAPPTPRRPTKPSLASRQRRIEKKRATTKKKLLRRAPAGTDDC